MTNHTAASVSSVSFDCLGYGKGEQANFCASSDQTTLTFASPCYRYQLLDRRR
jgi:hypothetical protein